MNYIWSAMLIASVVCAAVSGRLDETAAATFEGAAESVKVLLSFAGIMCFWTGILRVAEKAGICAVIEKLLSPVIRLLFPKAGSGAKRCRMRWQPPGGGSRRLRMRWRGPGLRPVRAEKH